MSEAVWVLGASMTKISRYPDKDVIDLASEASLNALADGGVTMKDMGVLASGCMFAQGGIGQQIQKQIGQTGIPVYNVINACATGATAVRTVYMSIKAGEADMGIAIGAEQMGKMGLLGGGGLPRTEKKVYEPGGRYGAVLNVDGYLGSGTMPAVFGQAGMEYAYEHDGVGFEQFAKVAEKNHAHSALNPLAQYNKVFTLDEIKEARVISWPNTLPMCCPTGDGAAAVVLVSDTKLKTLSLEQRKRAVKISASILTSDPWTEGAQVQPDVNTLTRNAAAQAYELAGVGPSDLSLVELHDCFATAELIHYDNLGLCEPGGAGDFIDSRAPWRDGKSPVNVSGGLLSKGHPIGMTGAAGVFEITTQLRGEAGDRQIEGAKVGMAHVIGLGSACGIHILEKAAA
ncbi:MAG: thiolase family protein [Acidimicrobiia bacterium]